MRRSQIITVLTSLALAACSLLFKDDAAVKDADVVVPIDADLATLCSDPGVFADATGLGIQRGQVVDLNLDGRDEVVLIAKNSNQAPQIYVHDGRCPVGAVWDFQLLWAPLGTMEAVDDATLFEPHVLAAVPSTNATGTFFALVGEQGTKPVFASYRGLGSSEGSIEIESAPSFGKPLPMHPSDSICVNPRAPYSMIAGDFDDDFRGSRDDLIFASGSDWVFRVDNWSSPPDWNADCVSGQVDENSIPDRQSGPGKRLGYVLFPPNGANGDDVLVARDNQVSWIFDFGADNVNTPWPSDFIDPSDTSGPRVPMDGVALSEVATVDDENYDLVGWVHDSASNMLKVYFGALMDVAIHKVDFTEAILQLSSSAPTAGALVSVDENQKLLLLIDSTLYLIDPIEQFTLLAQRGFQFPPKFFLTPNWGAKGKPQILVFNDDNGDYVCVEISSADAFVNCES